MMKAARIIKPKESLEIQDIEIHLWQGGYEGPGGQFLKTTDRGVTYPLTPGHEVSGIVENIGEEVQQQGRILKKDKVLVYPWIGEGLCPACRLGEENLCDNPRSLGIYKDGGYAEYILIPSYRYLVKLPEHIDMDVAATLSCSALTAYGAVKNADMKPYDNVVIVGAGGLGLMAMQLAKAVSGAKIIALDLDDKKLKVAKDNGADEIINTNKETDITKSVMELTNNMGADAVVDFVNASKTVDADMKFLRRRAKVVL